MTASQISMAVTNFSVLNATLKQRPSSLEKGAGGRLNDQKQAFIDDLRHKFFRLPEILFTIYTDRIPATHRVDAFTGGCLAVKLGENAGKRIDRTFLQFSLSHPLQHGTRFGESVHFDRILDNTAGSGHVIAAVFKGNGHHIQVDIRCEPAVQIDFLPTKLLDGGSRMRLEIRAFHGLKDSDLVLLCHFASFFYHFRM
jgi:hypothetical protein